MEVFLFFIVLVAVVTGWARAWGRSGVVYFILAAILSPFLRALILIVHGKSPEKKAEQLLLTETALANKRFELENKRAELALRR
jgi:hypothetical protein